MTLPVLPRRVLATALVCLATACTDNTGPNASVTGTYQSIQIKLTEGATVTDLLAAGVKLSMQLRENGTTTGSLLIPAEFTESGEEEVYNLSGTYTYDKAAGTVTFEQTADTFVRDATWTVEENELHGSFDGGDYSLSVIMQIAPGINQP